MKKFYFISGMPRSGSTLLANILNQNPNFYATATSGVLDLLLSIRNSWDNVTEFRANRNDIAKEKVIQSILYSFYEDKEKSIIFEKSRGWIAHIEFLEKIMGEKAKILVPVRDVREVLSSFEKLWRETSKTNQTPQERENYIKFQTVQGRCGIHLEENQPVGLSINRIKDAFLRGFKDRLYLVDFDDLTKIPNETMMGVYKFLNEEFYQHNFDYVEQVTQEDDSVHGYKDLHTIRNKVEPVPLQWPTILGSDAEKYGVLNFWKRNSFN